MDCNCDGHGADQAVCDERECIPREQHSVASYVRVDELEPDRLPDATSQATFAKSEGAGAGAVVGAFDTPIVHIVRAFAPVI